MPTTPKIRRRKPTKAQKDVFGQNVKLDETGRPVERGHGAPGHETAAHWQARLKKALEADHRDEAEISICNTGLEVARKEAEARNLKEEAEYEDDDEDEGF